MKKVILALVASIVVAAGPAYAVTVTAYGVAWDNIFNGFFSFSQAPTGGITPVDTTGIVSSGINGASGTNMAPTGSNELINNTSPVGNSIGSPVPGTAGNMTQIGPQSTNYAIGQAQIPSVQSPAVIPFGGTPTTFIQAVNKAEANVNAPPITISGAQGSNSSTTSVEFQVVVSPGVQIRFQGDAAPYVFSELLGPVTAISKADSKIDATLSITAQGATTPAFNWAPNGSGTSGGDVSGSIGGTVQSDPFSLNIDRSATTLDPTNLYDPTGGGAGTIGNQTPGAFGAFEATTNPLPAGTYTVVLSMDEIESDIVDSTVPEPGTIVLVGAGILGLAAISRRKRS